MSNYGELYIEICKFYSSKKKQKKNKWPDGEIDHGLIIDIFNQYKWWHIYQLLRSYQTVFPIFMPW